MKPTYQYQPVEVSLPGHGVFVLESHHAPDFRMAAQCHDFVEIFYVLDGTGRFHFEDHAQACRRGDIVVVPIRQVHRIEEEPSAPLALYGICVDPSVWRHEPTLLDRLAAGRIAQGHYQISWRDGARVATAFDYHPRPGGLDARTNLYYLETRDQGKTWPTVQGKTVETPLTTPDNSALVHDYEKEKLLVYLKDLAFDGEGRPVILYLTSKGHPPGPTDDPRTWRTARWTGDRWDIRSFTTSDHNYDHGSLYIEAGGTCRLRSMRRGISLSATVGNDTIPRGAGEKREREPHSVGSRIRRKGKLMTKRVWLVLPLVEVVFLMYGVVPTVQACCPAPPSGKPVVNADQTVLTIWDAATKTQHFIRQASFKSDAEDFGFLVPSPDRPELAESGNGAFDHFRKLTEPERKKVSRPSGGVRCGCGAGPAGLALPGAAPPAVRVLEEKMVAGLHAVVLETNSSTALVGWLKGNGYAFSPEVQAWAKPYVENGWKITALRVAKRPEDKEDKDVAATALRMTFHTDRPLFPYREPESRESAEKLGTHHRLLRIYFVAEARYRGELTPQTPWTGRVAWAGKIGPADRRTILELLKLPAATGPAEWWLTEFEDNWPYQTAPADVYFSRSPTQDAVRRPPILEYTASSLPSDAMVFALAAVVVLPPLVRRRKNRENGAPNADR